MKKIEIKINNKFNKSIQDIEKKKIKWFVSSLEEKYSAEAIEMSINKINEIKKGVSQNDF